MLVCARHLTANVRFSYAALKSLTQKTRDWRNPNFR